MNTVIPGVVKNGLVVPGAPLPEGARVEIRLCDTPLDIPPELQEELQAWQHASANALELAELLAKEMEANDKR